MTQIMCMNDAIYASVKEVDGGTYINSSLMQWTVPIVVMGK